MDGVRRFVDRDDAGRRLAEEVGRRFGADARPEVVLGIPRGGVIVAVAVARALDLPLDVVVVRKVGCPGRPELGVGAIGEAGVEEINTALLDYLQLDLHGAAGAALAETVRAEREEADRRVAAYVGARPRADLAGLRVLVVDDGLATGYTMLAAIEVARRRGAVRVVAAVPVAAVPALHVVEEAADVVVALWVPRNFSAVGAAYRDFDQTTDAAVVAALNATGA